MPPANFYSQPKATTRMSSRHRPLHTCGVSMLAIVDIVVGKTQDINGPLGSTLRSVAKLAKFATPLIYAMQFQWLTILSFFDDFILAIEKTIEKLFPPSTRVFDKVDELVVMTGSLPEKFDGLVTKFPTIIHEIPFLDWALTLVISRLNSLVSTLKHWGQENSRVNEKTIGVDRSCNELAFETCVDMGSLGDINGENLENFPPIISEAEHKGVQDNIAISSHMKGSYKEALERGKEESTSLGKMEKECEIEKKVDGGHCDECEGREEKNDGNNNYECEGREQKKDENNYEYEGREEKNDENNYEEVSDAIMKSQDGGSESVKDALLELFESAWLKKGGRY